MDGMLWKMNKAAYGLYDAIRRWWIRAIELFLKLGGRTLVVPQGWRVICLAECSCRLFSRK